MYPGQLGVLLLGKVSAPGCAPSLWALPTGSVLLPGRIKSSQSLGDKSGTLTHISRCVAFSKGGMVLK